MSDKYLMPYCTYLHYTSTIGGWSIQPIILDVPQPRRIDLMPGSFAAPPGVN